ncbi:hypothetical protein SAMN02910456_01735 [Ruminococcaceae bacterium YRB3002]|nr:hypothetical protein SAMN02910456_01735 [Ruminococcaceae bacterium YRB3002]
MNPRKIELFRKLIIVAVILYGVCPDLFPGPVDDLMVIIMGVVAYISLGAAKNSAEEHYA